MTDELKPIVFGNGDKVVVTGFSYGQPAVLIAPAKQPGEVGASAEREGNPRDTLLDGEIVLTFPTEEQAKSVADALCNVPANPLDDQRVKALVEAATELHDKAVEKHQRHRSDIWPVIRKLRAALSALETKP